MKPPPLTLVNFLQDLDTRMRRQERRMQGVLSVAESLSVLAVQSLDEIPVAAADGSIFVVAPTLMVVQKRDGVLVREDGAGPLTVQAALDWSP
jgi:hypothetical protein